MDFQLYSHTTTDVKPEMLSGVQTGNRITHDEYNMCGIAHACAYRKDHIFMQRRLLQSFISIMELGQRCNHLTTHTKIKHTRCWNIPLCSIFYLYSVSLGDALTTAAMWQFFITFWLNFNIKRFKTIKKNKNNLILSIIWLFSRLCILS